MTYPPPPPAQQRPGGVSPSSEERSWAVGAHLGALVSAWFALGFIVPLFVLLTRGQQSEFVRRHAAESVNFQLNLLVWSAVAVALAVLTLAIALPVIIPIALVVMVLALLAVIKASSAAGDGRDYRYPLTVRVVS